jgi:hypothetical protein
MNAEEDQRLARTVAKIEKELDSDSPWRKLNVRKILTKAASHEEALLASQNNRALYLATNPSATAAFDKLHSEVRSTGVGLAMRAADLVYSLDLLKIPPSRESKEHLSPYLPKDMQVPRDPPPVSFVVSLCTFRLLWPALRSMVVAFADRDRRLAW